MKNIKSCLREKFIQPKKYFRLSAEEILTFGDFGFGLSSHLHQAVAWWMLTASSTIIANPIEQRNYKATTAKVGLKQLTLLLNVAIA